jgi:hypothetical protein
MKKHCSFFIGMLCQLSLIAQFIEPSIHFDLYFEDALGNRDTVTYGYDSLANQNINPIFGEVNIRGSAFDSIFEVRGSDISGYQFQTNPTVHGYTSIFCNIYPVVQYQSMIIYAKHWPVTITWDSTYFEEECYDWTHITRIWDYLFHPDFTNGDIRLLHNQEKLIVYKQYMQQSVSYYNTRLEPIEGGIQDTVYNLWVGLSGNVPTISTDQPDSKNLYSAFPNPTSGELQFSIPNTSNRVSFIQIRSMLGTIEPEFSWRQIEGSVHLNVSNLTSAHYQALVYFKDNKPLVFHFLKE